MPPWVPRAILLYFVGLAAFGTLAWLIGRLQTLLLDMFVALFLSFALEPVVNWLQNRGWRRGWATGAAFIGLLVFTAVFLFAIGAVVFDQVNQFIDRAPEYAQDAADFVNDRFGANVSVEELQDELTREDGPVQSLATRLAGNALGVGASALGIIFRLLTIGLFTFYLVADGPRFRRTVCSFLPESRQHRVLETWEIAIDKTGGYLYSRALLALVSALFHWAFFQVIGVPYAAALGVVRRHHLAVRSDDRHLHRGRRAGTGRAGARIPSTGSGCWASWSPTSRSRTTCSPRGSPPAPWPCTLPWRSRP